MRLGPGFAAALSPDSSFAQFHNLFAVHHAAAHFNPTLYELAETRASH